MQAELEELGVRFDVVLAVKALMRDVAGKTKSYRKNMNGSSWIYSTKHRLWKKNAMVIGTMDHVCPSLSF